ncbi:hypothetical protein IT570_09945 [Candidatus Sumerlaeota bacterium]|nr:hypothetical protein [Candidatus Sumerlaeota bacterium]
MQQRTYPVQTRACFLSPEHLDGGPDFAQFIEHLIDAGYNAFVVPALHEGEVVFDVGRSGNLRGKACSAREALVTLQDYPVSVWLSADLLRAGPHGARRMGGLAARNRSWLMRNVDGGHEVLDDPLMRGLFCWTTLDFRRFVANMLVDILEAHAVDALLLDVSALPRTTENPRTWMQFGFSSLRRMQKELDIDGEKFLTNPTREKFHEIEKWRTNQLSHFIESIKMRACEARQATPLILMANMIDHEDPYLPWKKLFTEGIVEEMALCAPPESVPAHLRALDHAMGAHRPVLATLRNEGDLALLSQSRERMSSLGVCLTHPVYTSPVDFPPAKITWSMPGALERHPLTAGAAALIYLAHNVKPGTTFAAYVTRLKDFLDFCGERIKFEDVLVIRDDLFFLRKEIDAKHVVVEDDRLIAALDLATRLFSLIPAPVTAF